MLGKLTHWLSMKLELEDKEDDSLRLRFDALVRLSCRVDAIVVVV